MSFAQPFLTQAQSHSTARLQSTTASVPISGGFLPLGNNAERSSTNALAAPGVSEIVIPAWEQASFELVLPMLAHLSHQAETRWLTWIGKSGLSKTTIAPHPFAESNLRMISSKSDEETLWMMWEALNNGTSAFVAASFDNPNSVQEKERQLLTNACHNGHSRALIIKCPSC